MSGLDLAKDLVLATLCKPFPTAKLARAAARAMIDSLAPTLTIRAFIEHTVQDLEDKEEATMQVTHTLTSPLPGYLEIRCLNTSPIPLLAP